MRLDELSEEGVLALELATGVPLVYELAEDGTVQSKTTLD
jgi:2,3-bisphosphoglycerate-dependent phosphoglycerate mutase